jgi:mono/diheme cytochrome c family protein
MLDCRQERELKPVPGLVLGLAGALATAVVVALAAFVAPQPADALPAYAQQTKLACGRCHVSAAGGGALTAFGKAFAANGHKVPSKGAKPGKSAGDGTPVEAAPPAAAPHMTIRGTATVFFTTAPGVSNHSATIECFNCGVFVDR